MAKTIYTLQNPAVELGQYYQTAASIASYILGVSKRNDMSNNGSLTEWVNAADHHRSFGGNGYYGAIPADGSLILESYYGLLTKFLTPLGEVEFGESGGYMEEDRKKVFEILTEKLGLVEILPKKVTDMGEFGPFYAITKDLEGNSLPLPNLPVPLLKLDEKEYLKACKKVKPDLKKADDLALKHLNPSAEILSGEAMQAVEQKARKRG